MQKDIIKHFQLKDFQEWNQQLLKTGCVVIKNVLSKQEVLQAQDYFWEWLEKLGNGILRSDPNTWENQNWPGLNDMGFFVSNGGCHTKASWMIRTHPNVKSAFSKIWSTDKLITSFDTIISWRPWWNKASEGTWNPYVQNLHIDQNPHYKKGLKCVQGMVPLKRVRQNQVGGLQVVPNSNQDQVVQQVLQRYPFIKWSDSDWVELKANDPLNSRKVLVQCEAGDLILWESRTVHAGKICQPDEQWKKLHDFQLVRLSVTVSMVPREWCSEENLQLRWKYFLQKIGTTHWPHQPLKNPMGKMVHTIKKENITYQFPSLTPQIQDLV